MNFGGNKKGSIKKRGMGLILKLKFGVLWELKVITIYGSSHSLSIFCTSIVWSRSRVVLFLLLLFFQRFSQCQNCQFHCLGAIARLWKDEIVDSADVGFAGWKFIAKFESQEFGESTFAKNFGN